MTTCIAPSSSRLVQVVRPLMLLAVAALPACGPSFGAIAFSNGSNACAMAVSVDGQNEVQIAAGETHRFEQVEAGDHTVVIHSRECELSRNSWLNGRSDGCDVSVRSDKTETVNTSDGYQGQAWFNCPEDQQ